MIHNVGKVILGLLRDFGNDNPCVSEQIPSIYSSMLLISFKGPAGLQTTGFQWRILSQAGEMRSRPTVHLPDPAQAFPGYHNQISMGLAQK